MAFLDSTGLTAVWNKIKATFVAKETGKGLSTNDYTNTEKNKLGGIATGAQVNVIETVKVNGTAQTVTNKAVDIAVPTGALAGKNEVAESDLNSALATKIDGKANTSTTLAGYGITNAYTKTEVDNAISARLGSVLNFRGNMSLSYIDYSTRNKGDVYNITHPFTVSAGDRMWFRPDGNQDAINGNYPAGTNIVCVDEVNQLFDILSGTIDTSAFVTNTDTISTADINSICV